MFEVSSTDVQRDFEIYRAIAEGADQPARPVVVLHDNHPSVVIVSIQEFTRLIWRDRIVSRSEDMPGWMVRAIEAS